MEPTHDNSRPVQKPQPPHKQSLTLSRAIGRTEAVLFDQDALRWKQEPSTHKWAIPIPPEGLEAEYHLNQHHTQVGRQTNTTPGTPGWIWTQKPLPGTGRKSAQEHEGVFISMLCTATINASFSVNADPMAWQQALKKKPQTSKTPALLHTGCRRFQQLEFPVLPIRETRTKYQWSESPPLRGTNEDERDRLTSSKFQDR